jgi:thiol-disulfide isomerase/thioredoxin
MKLKLLTGLLITVSISVLADYPEIGKPCPNYNLKNIRNYKSTNATLNEFFGKPLIVELWNNYCSACIPTIKETNQFASEYKGKLNFVVIAQQDPVTKDLYEKLTKRFGLTLTIAFDSATYNQIEHYGAPHFLWIDKNGIISAITTGDEFTKETIETFIAGRSFTFIDASYKGRQVRSNTHTRKVPFLVNGNGGNETDFKYRSLLAEYKTGMPTTGVVQNIADAAAENGVQGFAQLKSLYFLAYTGWSSWLDEHPIYLEFYPKLILELSDTTPFTPNYTTGKNLYWYSQIVPPDKATPQYLMKVMQNDLENYFGYEVSIETRSVPCWKLRATDQAKVNLKSKGKGIRKEKLEHTGAILLDRPMKNIIHNVFYKHLIGKDPIIDETGITDHVDVSVDTFLDDINLIAAELKKIGLILTKDTIPMKVVVIRDPRIP